MIQTKIITPKVVTGFVSRQTNLGIDSYDLNELYSPDTDQWKSKVLDLGSPKYPPQVATAPQRYWFDRSRYNNHGTITGAIWVKLPSGLWVLNFNGVDDKITMATSATLLAIGNSSFTVSAWVKTSNTTALVTVSSIFDYLGQNPTSGYAIFRIDSGASLTGAVKLDIYDGTNNATCIGTTDLRDGKWHKLTGVRVNQSKLRVYVDGVQEKETNDTTTGTISGAGTHVTTIGGDYNVPLKALVGLSSILNTDITASQESRNFQNERHLFGV